MYLCGESRVCYILPLVMRDMWEKVEPEWYVCFQSKAGGKVVQRLEVFSLSC